MNVQILDVHAIYEYKESELRNQNQERNDFLEFFYSWIRQFFLALTIDLEYSPNYKTYVSLHNENFETQLDIECEMRGIVNLPREVKRLLKESIFLEIAVESNPAVKQRRSEEKAAIEARRKQEERSMSLRKLGFHRWLQDFTSNYIPTEHERIGPAGFFRILREMKQKTEDAIRLLKSQITEKHSEYNQELTSFWVEQTPLPQRLGPDSIQEISDTESESDEDFLPRIDPPHDKHMCIFYL